MGQARQFGFVDPRFTMGLEANSDPRSRWRVVQFVLDQVGDSLRQQFLIAYRVQAGGDRADQHMPILFGSRPRRFSSNQRLASPQRAPRSPLTTDYEAADALLGRKEPLC
jgi:hypothetical protein